MGRNWQRSWQRWAGVVGLGVSFVAMGCRGRPRSWDVPGTGERPRDGEPAVLEFDLSAGAPEFARGGMFGLPSRHTFDSLVTSLVRARSRQNVRGIFLTFGAAPLGWARSHEVADGLAYFRQAKVPISCHADVWDNATYALAVRSCDVISLSPGGEIELTGPAAIIPYARELLVDKLKAQVDILQVGKFKGAAEPLTRDGPSDEYRASIEGALTSIREQYVLALQSRGLGALQGTGPYAAAEALEKKLIDVVQDKHAARNAAITKAGGEIGVDVVFGPDSDHSRGGLAEVLATLVQPPSPHTTRPHVRLWRLNGEIALSGERGMLGGRSGIVGRQVVDRARALAEDPRVKAVVLRIDSPGGSALGSDLAWIALKELRDRKPVVVSVGELAASGGYYLASAGTRIFAEPESIVGSIGVVGGKVSFSGTLEMAGVRTAAFGDVRAASLGSPLRPWDDVTRGRLLTTMTQIYDLFLSRISEGRGRPRADFENAVEGRVFGGKRALELGLIDEIGGLEQATAFAKIAAKLAADTPVVVDEPGGLLDALTDNNEAIHRALSSGAGDFTGSGLGLGLDIATQSPELAALIRWTLVFAHATEGGRAATLIPAPLLLR